MPPLLHSLEIILHWLGAFAGLGTLAYSLYRMFLAQSRPAAYQTGGARQVLRAPYLLIATLLFVILGYLLWNPLPIVLTLTLQLIFTLLGAGIFLGSLALYLWGLRTLGKNFNASSGFGVRLQQSHQLVTSGPYAYIRHPMYVGVILAGWGGLLLYRTWTMLFFAVIMFGLIYRAHKEDQALSSFFSPEWEQYKQNVPAWIPRSRILTRKDD